jgi:hypothetical protein
MILRLYDLTNSRFYDSTPLDCTMVMTFTTFTTERNYDGLDFAFLSKEGITWWSFEMEYYMLGYGLGWKGMGNLEACISIYTTRYKLYTLITFLLLNQEKVARIFSTYLD